MEYVLDFIKKYLVIILLTLSLLVFIGLSGYLYYLYSNQECPTLKCDSAIEEPKETKKIYVDVKGNIKKEGVYEVKENAIINDVIKLAGGFTKNAYTKNINLSKKVSDELVIYVYSKSEYKKLNAKPEVIVQNDCSSVDYNIDNCTDNGSSIIISGPEENLVNNKTDNNIKDQEQNINNIININTATLEELITLNGIGESKAQAIIDYRNTSGGFKSIEEIKNVSGIGDAAYEKIKNNITV